ncbi:MAG: prolyl aminopeptidase [Methylococcaceae bacterium]|nr:prolyl aminopeptidase [Methylococcaceae bacterium]
MKTLYPDIEPFHSFFLQTDSIHSIYVEQSGNPRGISVIFLHGGPCSGTKPRHRCFFNPEKYHIILIDQRGCGQSMPFGEIEQNTTQDLIDDLERIRKQLKIKRWVLFGGSWGATLTLLYAQQHPDKVLAMIIRGVFLARKKDLDWFVNEGVGLIYPEKWQQLVASVFDDTSTDLVKSLYDVVFGDDELAKRRVTKAWMEWGGQVALMQDYQEDEQSSHVTEKMLQLVQMEIHYAFYKYFITENQILEGCEVLQNIPTIIIHGRNDLVCPLEAGFALSKSLTKAEFIVLSNAGHIASGEEMIDALVSATDEMLRLI